MISESVWLDDSSGSKDNFYLFEIGHIFTSSRIATKATLRRSAVISLSVNRESSFQVHIGGSTGQYQAVAVKPLVRRSLYANNVPLVSFVVTPLHACFRRFRAIQSPGLLPIERRRFASFDPALAAAYRGELSIQDAADLYESVINTLDRHLPPVKPRDARIQRIVDLLRENPEYSLEQIAALVGISRWRMTHLFAEGVGLPLRSYQLWQKTYRVHSRLGSRRTLTEIAQLEGFANLPHLSRVFRQVYGIPLSHLLNGDRVRVFYRDRTDGQTSILDAPPRRRLKNVST